MKYKVVNTTDGGYDIFTEDGGVASVSCVDGYSTTYYQSRLTSSDNFETMWQVLAEGKAYVKDWPDEPTLEKLVQDALSWLVMPMCDSMNEIGAAQPLSEELDWLVW